MSLRPPLHPQHTATRLEAHIYVVCYFEIFHAYGTAALALHHPLLFDESKGLSDRQYLP